MDMVVILYPGFSGSTGLPDGPSGHSGDQPIPYVFNARRGSIDVSYPHVGMDGYLVVGQSLLGVTSM